MRFATHRAAETVLFKRKALKGSKIVISEDLTANTLQRLRKLKQEEFVHTAWTKRGEIYIKDTNNFVTKIIHDESPRNIQSRLKQLKEGRAQGSRQRKDMDTTGQRRKSPQTSTPKSRSGLTETEARGGPDATPIQKKLQNLALNSEEGGRGTEKLPKGPLDKWITQNDA